MIKNIIDNGDSRIGRSEAGTKTIFGGMMRYDLSQTFPLLTYKKVFWRGVAEELLWFIAGSTNAKILQNKGIHIWDGNSSK
jgi:thymidylate synthase